MDRVVDIFHPFAQSLEWRECRGPPVNVNGAHAVWLKDKIYVGGGWALGSRREEARLYIYTPATDEWTTLDTPVRRFGLTTYHSQLVLVGGKEYVGENIEGELTNKLWTLSENGQWQETLPPMPKICGNPSAVSFGDHLLVIGDNYPTSTNKVHVYNGHHWASAQHPPQRLGSIKSTIFNGHWYVMGNGEIVYSASLDSLLASCQPSETSQLSSLWKRLTDTPGVWCYPAVFGNRLVAVGAGTINTSLHAYSSHTQSWVHMANMPFLSTPCAVLLPSNELIIVSEQTAFQSKLTLTPFDPESSFTLKAVSLLESAAGIPVKRTLRDYTHHIKNILGLSMITNPDLMGVFNYWLSGKQSSKTKWLLPSWRNLLQIIRLLHQDELAQRMEIYLSTGATEELSPTRGKQGDEEVDEQIRLRDDVIFQLKQQMATQQQRIADLECRNKEIEELSQIPIKEEERPVALLPGFKTELKEEPLTLEGEPHALLSVKREVKEEAVPMTKAETTSAQPTTATWNLRGVEVCGEMTVVVYSSHGQQIPWPGYGLRLNIPKGCLPAGMEQCTINIKASLAGQYKFPENSHLVSAIFWLYCKDVHKFTKPITVEIQHCAKSENITNLSFVRAICSQKQLPYTFKQLPEGNFTSHSSYGVIELNSFSGVGVTQEGSEDREYYSQLFYLGQPNPCKIHYVVTWNIDAHLTVVRDSYEKKGAVLGVEHLVEFEEDSITVDIPEEGTTIKGWKVTPMFPPVVTKKQVDNFREGKLTPYCQLKAEVSEKIPVLNHRVLLQGARRPYNFFTLELPVNGNPDSQAPQTSGDLSFAGIALLRHAEPGPPPKKRSKLEAGSSTMASGLDTKLDLNTDHYKIASYLRRLDDHQIRCVGGALGLAFSTLDKIKDVPSETAAAWLRREDYVMAVSGEPTWRSLVNALRKEGQEGTARDIEDKQK